MAKAGSRNSEKKPKEKTPIGLIFCEDENDAESLKNLAYAIRSDLPRIEYCRKPLILMRDRKEAEARKHNAAAALAVVRAKEVDSTVLFVIAHQDCDAVEPAHARLSATIKQELQAAGIRNVVAVAPAWETEAWWFLWPDAVSEVNSKWTRLKRTGNHGMIRDAKETLRRDLRNSRARDYEESDSRRISEKVLTLGIVAKTTGACSSFSDYQASIKCLEPLLR